MKIRIVYRLALAGLVVVGLLFSGKLAQAHETRPVTGGKYSFRVGFINEPSYQGLENGLQLTICKGDCVNSKDTPGTLSNGVTGAFDTLKAEVIFGGQSMPLTLTAVPRNPGLYEALFVPTRVGDYTFHISGTLDTDKIDERFTSGPDTFDSVQPLTLVQFPDKPGYPAANATSPATPAPTTAPPPTVSSGPTVQPLAQPTPAPAGVDAATVQDLRSQLNSQKQQLDEAKNNAASANTLGLVGLVAGLLGLAVAAFALLGRRGPKQPREAEGG